MRIIFSSQKKKFFFSCELQGKFRKQPRLLQLKVVKTKGSSAAVDTVSEPRAREVDDGRNDEHASFFDKGVVLGKRQAKRRAPSSERNAPNRRSVIEPSPRSASKDLHTQQVALLQVPGQHSGTATRWTCGNNSPIISSPT